MSIRYNIRMKELPEGLLDEMVRRLVDALRPERIYLFGSYAYGTPTQDSDLDFLIVVPDNAGDIWALTTLARRSLRDLMFPKDILVIPHTEMEKWAPVKCSLPHTVVKKGKLLYVAGTGISLSMAETR
jgi:uncharacterized protein